MGLVSPTPSRRLAVSSSAARSLAAGALLAGALACKFTPPPPLPEELAAQEAEAQARRDAVRGGQAGDPEAVAMAEGGGDGSEEPDPSDPSNPWGYRRGEPADLGMSPE